MEGSKGQPHLTVTREAEGKISLPKIVFDGIWAIMDAMMMAVKFQKKTRIVVDYDPQSEKWSIAFNPPSVQPGSLPEAEQSPVSAP